MTQLTHSNCTDYLKLFSSTICVRRDFDLFVESCNSYYACGWSEGFAHQTLCVKLQGGSQSWTTRVQKLIYSSQALVYRLVCMCVCVWVNFLLVYWWYSSWVMSNRFGSCCLHLSPLNPHNATRFLPYTMSCSDSRTSFTTNLNNYYAENDVQ